MNLYNNEDIMPGFFDELVKLFLLVGPESVALSVYESGSRDGTPVQLSQWQRVLQHMHVPARIEALGTSSDWRAMCNVALNMNCTVWDCTSLRACRDHVRIPTMACLRNAALEPFFPGSACSESSIEQGTLLELGADDHLLFMNDVLWGVHDGVELLTVGGGSADLTCSLDVERLKLYDTWVARDVEGEVLHAWYPYFRRPDDIAAAVRNEPVRVYSCWNGLAAFRGSVFGAGGVRFRSWRRDEMRSPHPLAHFSGVLVRDGAGEWLPPGMEVPPFPSWPHTYETRACAASECTLVAKDMWEQGLSRIFMHTGVQVSYNPLTQFLHNYVLAWLNPLLHAVLGAQSTLTRTAAVEAVQRTLHGTRLSPAHWKALAAAQAGLSSRTLVAANVLPRNVSSLSDEEGAVSLAEWWQGKVLAAPACSVGACEAALPPLHVACGTDEENHVVTPDLGARHDTPEELWVH